MKGKTAFQNLFQYFYIRYPILLGNLHLIIPITIPKRLKSDFKSSNLNSLVIDKRSTKSIFSLGKFLFGFEKNSFTTRLDKCSPEKNIVVGSNREIRQEVYFCFFDLSIFKEKKNSWT